MKATLLSGTAHPALSLAIARELGATLTPRTLDAFPDGELRVQLLADVRGTDVFLLQPTCRPVGDHLLELLLLSDACRRNGAARVTAVVPYFAYARQDRRDQDGVPLGAAVLAQTLGRAVDRAVLLDLHSPAVEGSFPIPVEHVSAVGLLAGHLGRPGPDAVVVSPDLGAVKRAERFARALGLQVAIVHKSRLSGRDVEASGVVGGVKGKRPIIVDDMISTAGTIEATVKALLDAGCEPEVTVCATHGLFVGPAQERLSPLPVRRLVVTDSLPLPEGLSLKVEQVSVAGLLAQTVGRMVG